MENPKKFKFETNLLKVSESKDFETAKKEWQFIFKETRNERNGLCICQRCKLKHVNYMYNVKTQHTIIVGSTCHKRFQLANIEANEILSDIMKKHLKNGDYEIIENVVIYSNSIEEELINRFRIEFYEFSNLEKDRWDNGRVIKPSEYVPKNLVELSKNVKLLIDNYELLYLQEIYSMIRQKIDEIYAKKKHLKTQNFLKSRNIIENGYKAMEQNI